MKCVKRQDGWWIINVPDTVTECGPYDTRAEAEEDRRGLERAFKELDAWEERKKEPMQAVGKRL